MSILTSSQAEKATVYTCISPDEMVSILADMGYRPHIEHTPNDFIRFQIEGLNTIVAFYGLDNGKAKSFQFRAY